MPQDASGESLGVSSGSDQKPLSRQGVYSSGEGSTARAAITEMMMSSQVKPRDFRKRVSCFSRRVISELHKVAAYVATGIFTFKFDFSNGGITLSQSIGNRCAERAY